MTQVYLISPNPKSFLGGAKPLKTHVREVCNSPSCIVLEHAGSGIGKLPYALNNGIEIGTLAKICTVFFFEMLEERFLRW